MADGYDRNDNEIGGGSFVMGLLTGTVLGAGLGMLFAPKAGSDLRNQMREQAGSLANTASEGYRRANEYAERGREMAGDLAERAREAVVKGAEEAQRYVRESTGASSNMTDRMASASGSGPSSQSSQSADSSHNPGGSYPGSGGFGGSRG